MAVELGRKIVKDTESFNDYAIGISLPIQITNTAFTQTFQTSEQVKSNIKNLLLTKKGERILQPEFGSGFQALLFEPNVDNFETVIEETINASLEKWLPYVSLEVIDIDTSNQTRDNNKINVSLKFRVGNNTDLNELTFTAQG